MTTLQPGQMLGPYQIVSQIGQGGMATVYKAYHAAMDRYVALKVVATQLSNEPDFLQRFRQEARLIAKLEHPRILPVYDYGEADGVPYMVMRFLDSGTLKERLAAGPLSLQEVDQIFGELADALAYAHENGVIHRDIKPSNAMLDKRGDVFLTDFGVAKILEGSAGLTATGAVTGTPAYMSPEQAQGLKVDPRSDIYSLGIVLFEMLTGHVPFEAETPLAVLFKQIQNPPPPLSLVRPDLPYQFEAVLLKALAKNPADRYASMNAFRDAWKQALTEAATLPAAAHIPTSTAVAQPAVSAPVQPAQVATPRKKAFPVAALLIVGALVCLAVGGFVTYRLVETFRSRQANGLHPGLQNVTPTGSSAAATVAAPPVAPVSKTTSWAAANSIYSIGFRDDEVIGAGPGGLTIWKRGDWSFRQFGTADGLPGAYVNAVFVDTDKSLWVATDSGLLHNSPGQNTLYTSDQGLDSEDVSAIVRAGDRLFAGTQYAGAAGGGLRVLDGSTWKPVPGFPSSEKPGPGLVSDNVNQVVPDRTGNLWVATENGIAMLDASQHWSVFRIPAAPADASIYSLYVDAADEVLAGTTDGLLAKFNRGKHAFESYLDLNSQGISDIYAIQQDKAGRLWFAGDNVASYDPQADIWTRFSAEDGTLPVHSARAIAMDDQGNLYFGTDREGLVRLTDGKFSLSVVPNAPHFAAYARVLPGPDGKLVFPDLNGEGADQFDPRTQTWTMLPAEQYTPLAFDPRGQMWSTDGDGLWIFGRDKTTHLTTHRACLPTRSMPSFSARSVPPLLRPARGLPSPTAHTSAGFLPPQKTAWLRIISPACS